MPKKPNILFLFSDQHHPGYLGCAGHPTVRTPHLDALAGAGVRLDRMYCPAPLCVPSRMAMLSGLLPSATGIYTNVHSLPSEQPTFVHSLRAAGYETVLSGRMHFNGTDQRHGFARRLVGDVTAVEVFGRGPDYGELQGTPGQKRVALEQSGPGNSNVLEYDRAVTEATISTIEQYTGAAPLFLTAGFYGPHCPFVCPPELFEYYYDRVELPMVPEGFREGVHPFIRQWLANRDITEPDPDAIRRSVAAYCGLVEVMDTHAGRILEAWRGNPALEDSLIVYVSDHGEMAGEKGMFWKSNFYEGSARIPCILERSGELPPDSVLRHGCSLLDLGPTLIDWAGGVPLPRSHGESLRPVLTGARPEDPERAAICLLGDVKGDAPGVMVRRGRWKLMVYHGYEHPQLFDLEADPDEWNDLGCHPEFEAVRRELREIVNPHWNGAAIAAEVERVKALMEFWGQWKSTVDVDSDERWKAVGENNYLS